MDGFCFIHIVKIVKLKNSIDFYICMLYNNNVNYIWRVIDDRNYHLRYNYEGTSFTGI